MKHPDFVKALLSSFAAVTALTACAEVDTAAAHKESRLASLAASERSTAELGVGTWNIQADGEETRIVGRDAASARRVELIVRRDAAAPDERVQLEAVFPERGKLELTRAGVVGDPPSEYLRRLAIDVHADLGQGASHVVAADGLGANNSAFSVTDLRISDKGTIHVDWGLFGHGMSLNVSGPCRAGTTRDHVEIYADNAVYGSTATWTWEFPSPPGPDTDCAAHVSLYVSGDHWDNFQWRVYSRPVDLAAHRPASQSSTPWGADASRAVDNVTDGNWYNSSVTHTDFDAQAWWEVDLGTVMGIGSVVLYNRTDCCSDRLSNFDIYLSNNGTDWATQQPAAGLTGPAQPRTEFLMQASGRFVRVQLRGTNYLSLAEVQVYVP